jgi:hypothetical protein
VKNEASCPGILIFAGRFGSGKTEVAINYALALAGGCGQSPRSTIQCPILIDLDIVTP